MFGAVAMTLISCGGDDSGSIEFSWRLRSQDGALLRCDQSNVSAVRLTWQVGGLIGTESWPCDDSHALTKFDVLPGAAEIAISADCESGPADPNSYASPGTIVRTVTTGRVVELGAVVLVLQLDDCNNRKCTCQ
jgi:hypothetical protein